MATMTRSTRDAAASPFVGASPAGERYPFRWLDGEPVVVRETSCIQSKVNPTPRRATRFSGGRAGDGGGCTGGGRGGSGDGGGGGNDGGGGLGRGGLDGGSTGGEGGGGKGEYGSRGPQSEQSVPTEQSEKVAPSPPSSHLPSLMSGRLTPFEARREHESVHHCCIRRAPTPVPVRSAFTGV